MASRKNSKPLEPPKKVLKKAVHYRRCRLQPAGTQTLQQLLSQAIADRALIKDRTETVDTAARSFRVISVTKQVGAMLCGAVLTFERGSYQMVINDDPEATTLKLTAMKPPMQGAVQQQFVPGVLFYSIFEDHVAVVQTSSLRTNGLEQHLAWLLRDQAKLLQKDQGLVLADEPKKATQERIKKSRVKSLSLGRPFMVPADPIVEDSNTPVVGSAASRKKTDVSRLKPDSAMVAMLRGFLPDDNFSALELDGTVYDGDLEVWLEIRYPARTRSQPASTAKLLDDLAIALRDQEGDSVELELADGTTVKGSDLKITGSLPLTFSDGLPGVDDFFASMAQWLESQIKNGMVTS